MPQEVWIRKFCMPREHRSLVKLRGWCIIDSGPPGRCNIYYEYCAGGDLHSLIPRGHPGQHPEAFIWHVFIQVAEALDAMHNSGPRHVIHQDVKPENVFLTSRYRPNHSFPTVKLGDYGSANTNPDAPGTRITWLYMAPENECSAEADIWALGAVIHALCHGFSPVSTKHHGWKLDPRARRPRGLPSRYSNALNHRMMSCLRVDRRDRPKSESLVRNLYRERPSAHS